MMVPTRLTIFPLLGIALIAPATAQAATPGFCRSYVQIASNAGSCSNCRLTMTAEGSRIQVTANNGWTAIVSVDPRAPSMASGSGLWKPGHGAYAGRKFVAHFFGHGKTMRLVLAVTNGAVIRASFRCTDRQGDFA